MAAQMEDLLFQLMRKLSQHTPEFSAESTPDEFKTVQLLLQNKPLITNITHWLKFLNDTYLKCASEIKCWKTACDWRLKGNDYYNENQFRLSIINYNNCVKFAPRNDINFVYALYNRACVLINEGEVHGALEDIELVISIGYPKEKIYKVYYREAQCQFSLGNLEKGRAACEKSIYNLTANSNLSVNNISAILKKLNDLLKHSTNHKVRCKKRTLPTLESENTILKGTSSYLQLKYSTEKGRHIIAKTDLKKNDILFVEEPFAFVALPNEDSSHFTCENCCSIVSSQFTCPSCPSSHYCCEICREAAWQKFHQWECMGEKMDLFSFTGIGRLALRTMIIASHTGFELDDISCDTHVAEDIINIFNTKENLSPGYGRVYNLVTNFENIEKEDLREYAFISLMLMYYLKDYTNFFTDHLPSKFKVKLSDSEMELFISYILLRHLLQMICNSSVITHRLSNVEGYVKTATAIYPSSSMMNHSCVPNTKNKYKINLLVVKAAEDIEAGSEVFNCYGQQAKFVPKDERLNCLRFQYGFECRCEACCSE